MGPHFFKCGKAKDEKARIPVMASFNGAALFQVRKESAGANSAPAKPKLQWGRTFSSAERYDYAELVYRDVTASMGPHFFKCGKFIATDRDGFADLFASMGPHFFKCGKPTL